MIVNKAALSALFTNIKTTFNKAFDAAPAVWQEIAMHVPSTGSSNDYKWLSRFPKMREWIGEKVFKRLEGYGFTLVNKPYEATVEVHRDDIDDDQFGIYGPQAQEAGFSGKQWPDELIMALVNSGFANLGYDGQYFFDTDHPIGESSYSNKGTAKLKADTLANAEASYGVAYTAIRTFKDEEGRPLNLMPSVLLVPPALETTAKAMIENEKLKDGQPNPFRGTAKVVSDGRLTDPNAWFLLVANRPVKPFIFQERKKPTFVSQTSEEADDVFNKAVFKFSVESRGNAGYGLPQLAYGSNGTV